MFCHDPFVKTSDAFVTVAARIRASSASTRSVFSSLADLPNVISLRGRKHRFMTKVECSNSLFSPCFSFLVRDAISRDACFVKINLRFHGHRVVENVHCSMAHDDYRLPLRNNVLYQFFPFEMSTIIH